jgi:hypothetical protein
LNNLNSTLDVEETKMGPIEKMMEKMVKQCRKPTGRFGRFVARGMNYGHSKVTRW